MAKKGRDNRTSLFSTPSLGRLACVVFICGVVSFLRSWSHGTAVVPDDSTVLRGILDGARDAHALLEAEAKFTAQKVRAEVSRLHLEAAVEAETAKSKARGVVKATRSDLDAAALETARARALEAAARSQELEKAAPPVLGAPKGPGRAQQLNAPVTPTRPTPSMAALPSSSSASERLASPLKQPMQRDGRAAGRSAILDNPGSLDNTGNPAAGSFAAERQPIAADSRGRPPAQGWRPSVTIMAHNRPEYLSKSLAAILRLVAQANAQASTEARSAGGGVLGVVSGAWAVLVSLDDPGAFGPMRHAVEEARRQVIQGLRREARPGPGAGGGARWQVPEIPEVTILEKKRDLGSGSDPLFKIARHVKFAMDQSFQTPWTPFSSGKLLAVRVGGPAQLFPTHVVLLEEDLLPASDFLELFQATAWLLSADPTLWCVSAWNDNGLLPHAKDPTLLGRTDYFPGLGWMMERGTWAQVSSKWPPRPTTGWDHWIRRDENSGGLECVVPEVPRTRHVATHGTNVGAAEQKKLARFEFAAWPPSRGAGSGGQGGFGDVSYLLRPVFDAALVQAIRRAPRVQVRDAVAGSGAAQRNGPVVVLYTREEYGQVARQLSLGFADGPRATHHGVIFARTRRGNSDAHQGGGGQGGGGHSRGTPLSKVASEGDRVLLVDRRRAAALLLEAGGARAETEAWRPSAKARRVTAPRGASCDAVCRRAGLRCDPKELEFANDCASLRAHFPCEGGCGHQVGDEIPAYVPDRQAATFGQCLVTDQRMPRCGASHRSTSRLCVCL